jgi:hypothetical protein
MMQQPWIMLAQAVWGRFDHERPGFTLTHLWILLGIAALLASVAVASYRSSRRSRRDFDVDSHAKLFRELCRAHQLPFAGRRLLKRLAAARGIAEPARLFIEPKHFDPVDLPADLLRAAGKIQRIRDRLFH